MVNSHSGLGSVIISDFQTPFDTQKPCMTCQPCPWPLPTHSTYPGMRVTSTASRKPARLIASMPSGASSYPTHLAGGTPISSAARRKVSGCGLPWVTSCSKREGRHM